MDSRKLQHNLSDFIDRVVSRPLKLGFDPIWFGVLMVHNVEMGLVTPPVGLAAFALKGVVPDVPLEEIFRSITPFLIMMLITLAVLMAFPQIALILPRMMS